MDKMWSTKVIAHPLVCPVSTETLLRSKRCHSRRTTRQNLTQLIIRKIRVFVSTTVVTNEKISTTCNLCWKKTKRSSLSGEGKYSKHLGKTTRCSKLDSFIYSKPPPAHSVLESELLDVQALVSQKPTPSLFIIATMNTERDVIPSGIGHWKQHYFISCWNWINTIWKTRHECEFPYQFTKSITKDLAKYSEEYFWYKVCSNSKEAWVPGF